MPMMNRHEIGARLCSGGSIPGQGHQNSYEVSVLSPDGQATLIELRTDIEE